MKKTIIIIASIMVGLALTIGTLFGISKITGRPIVGEIVSFVEGEWQPVKFVNTDDVTDDGVSNVTETCMIENVIFEEILNETIEL